MILLIHMGRDKYSRRWRKCQKPGDDYEAMLGAMLCMVCSMGKDVVEVVKWC